MQEAKNEAEYFFFELKQDPLMYPKTKGAISRMSEHDRNAYYSAVNSLRENIANGMINISNYYQIPIYQKHCVTVLRNSLKESNYEHSRNAAMNLYYCIVCDSAAMSAGFSSLWLRKYGMLCHNITYFNTGRIIGKRGDLDLNDYWDKYYQLIQKALDPELEVIKKTKYTKIKEMVEASCI